ncbi:hypothetical protein [Gaiella occulta]|uniref:hypothetical protein n=1 Tax=Gaiella occulta TaxID=1002870 RepID=UPI003BEEC615
MAGTPFDFTVPAMVGARIDEPYHLLLCAGGDDHGFVVGGAAGGALRRVATLRDPASGRVLEVRTIQHGFPSAVLRSGEEYRAVSGHSFRRARHDGYVLRAGPCGLSPQGARAGRCGSPTPGRPGGSLA